MNLMSPFAKPGYLGKQHYSTASIVKTEELLLGLRPNNLEIQRGRARNGSAGDRFSLRRYLRWCLSWVYSSLIILLPPQ
jgi:hypothetical protein